MYMPARRPKESVLADASAARFPQVGIFCITSRTLRKVHGSLHILETVCDREYVACGGAFYPFEANPLYLVDSGSRPETTSQGRLGTGRLHSTPVAYPCRES